MAKSVKLQEVAIDLLRPYERNAKIHPSDQVERIKRSIEEFGFVTPCVIDGEYNLIAGHGRVQAAKEMGMDSVPCVFVEGLTEAQRKAYILADNRLGELGEWDMELVFDELDDLGEMGFDVELTGFELPEDIPEVYEDDFEPTIPKEPKTKLGDVWKLGDHRLMCGDSTDILSVEKLMGGGTADICFSSPPYNMGGSDFSSAPNIAMNSGHAYGEYSDDLSDDDYTELICGSLENALTVCDDVLYNIGILQNSKQGIISMLDRLRDNFLDIVVWNKSQSLPFGMKNQKGMLSHRCELIFCFNNKGNRSFTHPQWEIGAGINRIDTGNAAGNEYASTHTATFPVEFAFEVVKMFSDESVLDLFGGTGTTMIACEQLNRKCYMMELDPHYCDVIIDRWETMTGQKAVLLEQ